MGGNPLRFRNYGKKLTGKIRLIYQKLLQLLINMGGLEKI